MIKYLWIMGLWRESEFALNNKWWGKFEEEEIINCIWPVDDDDEGELIRSRRFISRADFNNDHQGKWRAAWIFKGSYWFIPDPPGIHRNANNNSSASGDCEECRGDDCVNRKDYHHPEMDAALQSDMKITADK